MTVKDIVREVATGMDFDKKSTAAVTKIVDEVFVKIVEAMKAGEEVKINGFGKFYSVDVPEREVRNPLTGEKMVSSAHSAPKFTFSTTVKKALK